MLTTVHDVFCLTLTGSSVYTLHESLPDSGASFTMSHDCCCVQVPDEAPSSVNYWSRLPSPSNIHSSQSSILDHLGSASLPIEQLQLKASLPGATLPQQLPTPWGSGSTDNSPPLPQTTAMQSSSQTPWLSAWSQNVLQKPGGVNVPDHAVGSKMTLKRAGSPHENGEPVDSKPTKQRKLHEFQTCHSGDVNGCNHNSEKVSLQAQHEAVLRDTTDNNADTGSPNTSSHSSSPETAVVQPAGNVLPAQCAAATS